MALFHLHCGKKFKSASDYMVQNGVAAGNTDYTFFFWKDSLSVAGVAPQ